MGNYWATYVTHPDTMPVPEGSPTFDPMYGFPDGRKPRGKYRRSKPNLVRATESRFAFLLLLCSHEYEFHFHFYSL